MEEKGISYQILEATDKVGGRIQKDENFVDFPIDLGAEWIHEDKSILPYLTDQPGAEPNVETILYQSLNFYLADGNSLFQIPSQDMMDYTGDEVVLTTENGTEYLADKVILTVPVGLLRSNAIIFNPSIPAGKISAIQDVEFIPGFKLFMKFSDQFYPDVISS